MNALRRLGATLAGPGEKVVVRSQDIKILTVEIDGRILRVESETYVGLSIGGPGDLVRVPNHLTLRYQRSLY